MAFNLPRIRNKSEANNNARYSYLDNIFNEFFNDFYSLTNPGLTDTARNLAPRTDISETDTEYNLEVELPGVVQQNIELKIDNNILTIKGSREESSEDKNKNYHMRERYYGTFQRSISLPLNINEENVEARFENGILHIKIPKKEQSTSRKIEVKS
ncbi:Hsp20/alpha crystallin family protein [Rickettsia endosymbiont of Polydrusus tereticollis]|uniref:Hsp20/alpha crystallin family protein n=1 Tax=Rickettsia endosymbiont of Polydrusus tereticollis TaxID=3066251 RepID=UPI003132D0F2